MSQNRQDKQLPPRQDMVDARDQLKAFMATKGWVYLQNILSSQANGHQAEVNKPAEMAEKELHPTMYFLQVEYKKGVQQGLMIALQLPQLLIEQLTRDILEAAAKEEGAAPQQPLPGV